jgi:predicted phosphodiesterase
MEGERSPDWDTVLVHWGLEPEKFSVVEPVLFNVWGNPDGTLNRQWKGKVVRRTEESVESVDLSELMDEIRKHKSTVKPKYEGEGVFNVVLADWQMGKSEGGGTPATVQRVLDSITAVEARVKELRKLKRPLNRLNVLWTGDSVEGCIGHYDMQTFSVDLDRRQQTGIVRQLLLKALQNWSKHFEEVVVVAVGGNHGENRNRAGKSYTTLGDNDDLAVVEQVRDALAVNTEAYGHVTFVLPKDHLTVTVESCGWILGLTHGHVARSGAGAEGKLKRWFEQMAGSRQPIGDADILVTGHYHHMRVADWGGCYWLQSPALDGGSEWWRLMGGGVSETGVLTFATYPDKRVADLEVV